MLKRIILENWRSHANTQIDLREGSNMFLGSMGSGKSSVVDAICYGLYGTYPKLGRRDAKLADVRNFRHLQKQTSVEITWVDSSDNGNIREYRVRREVEPAQGWLYCDEKLLCKGARVVRDEVEKILEIPYELFARAVYAEQNKLDYWLSLSAGERKSEIDSLLGLDKFEKARSEAGREINSVRERAAAIEAEVVPEKIVECVEQVRKYEAEFRKYEKEIESAKFELEQLRADKKVVDEKFALIEKAGKEFGKLSQELSAFGAKIEGLAKNIEQTKVEGEIGQAQSLLERKQERIETDEKKIVALEMELKGLISNKSQLREKISQMRGKIERRKMLEQRLEQILNGGSLERLQMQKEEIERNLQKRREERAGFLAKNAELGKILMAFEAGATEWAKCPMCDSQITKENFEKVKAGKVAEKEKCSKEAGEIGEKIGEDEKALILEEKKVEDVKRLKLQIEEVGEIRDLSGLEREFSEIEKKEGGAARSIEELQNICKKENVQVHNLHSQIEKMRQIGKWKLELEIAVGQREQKRAEILKLEFCEKRYDEALSTRETVSQNTARMEQKIAGHQKICAQSGIIFEKERETLQMLEKKKSDALRMRAEVDELCKFREIVIATQAQLRENLIGEINLAMHRLWPIVYPYGDWGSVRLMAGEKDYALQIYQGEWRDLEAHASGGERACLGLCLRTALSVILTPHLGWLILDEPTHNLDERAVRALGESISESMPKIIPQLLVITHDSKLLESSHSRVLKFERDKVAGEDTRVFEV